jgi:hypothetical protein
LRHALPYMKGMNIRMKPLLLAVLAVVSFGAQAQDAPFAPVPADQVVMADLLYLKRAVVVFAESPNDPNYIRQMELLTRDTADLIERDVIVITDTAPKPPSDIRTKLRPSGFSLVILDKDGTAVLRKPLPWDTREITHAIDKFPSRRIEELERMPAGR